MVNRKRRLLFLFLEAVSSRERCYMNCKMSTHITICCGLSRLLFLLVGKLTFTSIDFQDSYVEYGIVN